MHLDEEEVEPVSQKHLVVSRGHAVEPLEELFLLLGGRWKHELCLRPAGERREEGSGLG